MPSVMHALAWPVRSTPARRRIRFLTVLLFTCALLSACGTSNPESTFDPETGRHPDHWSDPLAIGRDNFHANPIKVIQAVSPGAVPFGKRCAPCHGNGGTGKIGPDIRGADSASIAAAIANIPLMQGQGDLSGGALQEIADYLASLFAGTQPADSTIRTENCTACHGGDLDGGIARISCLSCHNGPDGSLGHPAAWRNPRTDPVQFHGSYGRRFNRSCTTCHGTNFEGDIGRACAICHTGNFAPILDFILAPAQPGAQAAISGATAVAGPKAAPRGALEADKGYVNIQGTRI